MRLVSNLKHLIPKHEDKLLILNKQNTIMFITFKNFSKVKHFVNTMNKKHSYDHDEGCGCCYSSRTYSYDPKTKLVLENNHTTSQGCSTITVEVLGKYKGKDTEEAQKWRW